MRALYTRNFSEQNTGLNKEANSISLGLFFATESPSWQICVQKQGTKLNTCPWKAF